MPYEDSLMRQKLAQQSRLARRTGEVAELQFPIKNDDTGDLAPRDNAIFGDLTGLSIPGFGVISGLHT